MENQLCVLPIHEQTIPMSAQEFDRFANLIYDECGIVLSPEKKCMVTGRLGKRLRALGMDSYSTYYNYVSTVKGRKAELVSLIDVITTNTTEFFREQHHFEFLVEEAIPSLISSGVLGRNRSLNVWSAGCSTGEEPYSIAMVLAEYYENHPGDFSILATDICSRALKKASNAIYDEKETKGIPDSLKRKYMMHGVGSQEGYWRMIPELRRRIKFGRLNFVDEEFDLPSPIHIIFCRNVIIYFDAPTKAALVDEIYEALVPGGYYLSGHSETLTGLNESFVVVKPTVFRKP